MRKLSIIFLQIVVILFGFAALAALIIFPQNEGRNLNADFFTIYFKDPFLAYVYLGSIAFFVAIYNALKLLQFAKHDQIFSSQTIKTIRTIKYCAITIIGFNIGAGFFIVSINRAEDDIAGGIAMGLFIGFISTIVLAVAITLEKILQSQLQKTT